MLGAYHDVDGLYLRGPIVITVAILAQGTHWAVAVTQAYSFFRSIEASLAMLSLSGLGISTSGTTSALRHQALIAQLVRAFG